MKKSKLLWLSAVLVMSVCTVGCGNNDDELDQSLTVDELSQSKAFKDLPLAIAERFIYMDAFYAPGASVAV